MQGKVIWFHGSSVGEVLSIMPLIERLEKNSKIKQIVITSSTLSSSKVLEKYKLNKTVHQFFPIDANLIIKKFLNYWKPTAVFFVESEIWPNMLINLNKRSINHILLNARITKKTFKRWKLFPRLSKKIFSIFPKAKKKIQIIKGGDHSLSRKGDLNKLANLIDEIIH